MHMIQFHGSLDMIARAWAAAAGHAGAYAPGHVADAVIANGGDLLAAATEGTAAALAQLMAPR